MIKLMNMRIDIPAHARRGWLAQIILLCFSARHQIILAVRMIGTRKIGRVFVGRRQIHPAPVRQGRQPQSLRRLRAGCLRVLTRRMINTGAIGRATPLRMFRGERQRHHAPDPRGRQLTTPLKVGKMFSGKEQTRHGPDPPGR